MPTESIVTLVCNSIGASINIKKTISQFLMQMGFLTHLKGYRYIVEAVAMLIENPCNIGRFQFDIYPKIAEKMGTSPIAVERSIRTVILKTYELHEKDYFKKYFNYYIQKPTNTEFISWCAEKIKAEKL